MKRLILMRHAKSDWSMDQEDHARPLNKRGQRSAKAMGDWLRTKSYAPDEILCSTAIRTRETLAWLSVDAQVRFDRGLYHASAPALLEALRDAERHTVLIIAHNPGIGTLANALPAKAPSHPRFGDYPTCATLVVEFDIKTWEDVQPGQGRVLDFIVARDLTD